MPPSGTEGQTGTDLRWRNLLAAAGFEMTAVMPTSGSVSVIEDAIVVAPR